MAACYSGDARATGDAARSRDIARPSLSTARPARSRERNLREAQARACQAAGWPASARWRSSMRHATERNAAGASQRISALRWPMRERQLSACTVMRRSGSTCACASRRLRRAHHRRPMLDALSMRSDRSPAQRDRLDGLQVPAPASVGRTSSISPAWSVGSSWSSMVASMSDASGRRANPLIWTPQRLPRPAFAGTMTSCEQQVAVLAVDLRSAWSAHADAGMRRDS